MRKIIHIDMDCFYAAIEMRDNPPLRGQPVAVGGRPDQRGVLCTCNYEARKYGIHSAQATAYALRLCPELIVLPVTMDKYKQVSRSIQEIFYQFTDRIEPLSLDEAYLDVSDCQQYKGSATLIAQAIRQRIFEKEQLTASAGVAPNKFLAKIASDWNKPNGQFVITPGEVEAFVQDLPVKKIFGVGKVTAEKLQSLGIQTCGDLQGLTLAELSQHFGSFGESLHRMACGIDERPVKTERQRKSLSVEETFAHDLPDEAACLQEFPSLLHELQRRLGRIRDRDRDQRDIKGVFVKIKYSDFSQTTIQTSSPIIDADVFAALFKKRYGEKPMPVRLLGIGVTFHDEQPQDTAQLDLQF